MKLIAPLGMAALVSACAASPSGNDLTRRSAVVVDGQTYDIGQLTESTGCKVTDSDYSLQGRQLDAQVDCAGRLKN
ncbi:MAG: hypothetical protein B7X59_15330 [Polaromonas sp. 39-63-203]|nr:MAG: hypothetical protein B7X59_15330 [Polaromonas sp. 39-63-203]